MSLVSIGDVSLNVVEKGAGQPLLLVHGFPLDHSMWRGQIDELSKRCRVIAPDLRGFGKSELSAGVPPASIPMEQFAEDLAALLTAMNVTQPVVFCGLSMGGYIAWPFSFRHSQRLARLILCDTRAAADSPEGAANRHKLADRVLIEGSQVAADAMLPKMLAKAALDSQQPFVEETRQVILRTSPETIAAALRGMAARPDYISRLGEIKVPTLVLCGELDAISPPAEMRSIAAAIGKSQYAEIHGAGHMSPLEDPAAVNRTILNFLSS